MWQNYFQPQANSLISAGILLILGLILWLNGYRIFRSFLALTGIAGGYALTQYLHQQLHFEKMTYWIVMFLLCLGGATLLWLAYRISFALAGATVGYYLVNHYALRLLDQSPRWSQVLAAVLGAVLALLFCKAFLVISTAWIGSLLLLNQGAFFLKTQPDWAFHLEKMTAGFPSTILSFVFPLLLLALGSWIQFRLLRKNPPRFLR